MASKYRPKNPKSYVLAPGGLNLDWYALLSTIPDEANKCYLVALDNRQLSVLHNLVSVFLPWYWLWNVKRNDQTARTAIQDFTEHLQECLMSGCSVEDLIKTQRMLIAEVSGTSVDLDSPLPTGVYSPVGLANKFTFAGDNIAKIASDGNDQQTIDLNAIKTAIENVQAELSNIKTAIESGDLEDDLANVWGKLAEIVTILGAVSGAPVPPL